eukprot:1161858-Pelagomonas_calceolata.AAC.4
MLVDSHPLRQQGGLWLQKASETATEPARQMEPVQASKTLWLQAHVAATAFLARQMEPAQASAKHKYPVGRTT